MEQIFAWGANTHGQLGLGNFDEAVLHPTKIQFPEGEIQAISGGGSHTFLTINDSIYVSGGNSQGQLGIYTSGEDLNQFRPFEYKFLSIFAGWDVSAGINEAHELFFWGSNQHEQQGAPKSLFKCIGEPEKSKLLEEKVQKVSFGLRHSAILTESGKIFVFGSCRRVVGALKCLKKSTLVSRDNHTYLILDFKGEKILEMASGQHHLLIQTKKNQVLAFGDNRFGQLGEFGLIESPSEIVKLKSGWTHSGFLTIDGELFLWGRDCYGQLGQKPSKEGFRATPTKMDIQERVTDFDLGSEHGILLTESGKVFTWGWNEHGNCGDGSIENLFHPKMIDLPGKCRKIVAGAGFCFASVLPSVGTFGQ